MTRAEKFKRKAIGYGLVIRDIMIMHGAKKEPSETVSKAVQIAYLAGAAEADANPINIWNPTDGEDERTRNEIIAFVEQAIHRGGGTPIPQEQEDSWIAWLEKQGEQKPVSKVKPKFRIGDVIEVKPMKCHGKIFTGKANKIIDITEENYIFDDGKAYSIELQDGWKLSEQKPADKVEPKFHKGDWVVCKNGSHRVFQVIERSWPNAKYLDEKGFEGFLNVFTLDKQYRPWTIQDAKDGDVLVAHECYVIFKEIDGLNIKCYCTYYYMGFNPSFYVDTLQNKEAFHPATKEQRDTLMKAMADAGYIFDFEKKELRKLKFRVGDIVKSKSQPMLDARKIISIGKDCYWCEDRGCIGFAWEDDCELVEPQPKQEWSEEDEKIYQSIMDDTVQENQLDEKQIDWIISLRDRVQPQPKQEWSEEDRKIIIELIGIFESAVDGGHVTFPYRLLKDYIRVLKSCLPQNT